jgi:hypothetical protein
MEVTPDDFRRYYSGLSDEALLDVPREDLTTAAQVCYDAEVASRGLHREVDAESAPTTPSADLVAVATFPFVEQARMARAVLESEGIKVWLSNENTLSIDRFMTSMLDGLRVFVLPENAEIAREILETPPISDEELAAQAEAAAPVEEEPLAEEDALESEEER